MINEEFPDLVIKFTLTSATNRGVIGGGTITVTPDNCAMVEIQTSVTSMRSEYSFASQYKVYNKHILISSQPKSTWGPCLHIAINLHDGQPSAYYSMIAPADCGLIHIISSDSQAIAKAFGCV